jgi:hypothetical protein
MALLFMDGFDNYNFLRLKWQENTRRSTFFIEDGVGRSGAAGLKIYADATADTEFLGHVFENNLDHLVFGFAFKKIKVDGGYVRISFNDGETKQNQVDLYSTGIKWTLGDDSAESSVLSCLTFNAWNYVEFKVKFHATLGEVHIRSGESEVLTLSGVNTIMTANPYADRIRLQNKRVADTNEDYAYIDDVYLCDTTGTINNDFLGNCEVNSYRPISQGSNSDFLLPPTVSGVDNYTMVDDRQVNNTEQITETFYVHSSGDDGCNCHTFGWEDGNDSTGHGTKLFLERTANYEAENILFIRFTKLNIPRHAKITSCTLNIYIEDYYTSSSRVLNSWVGFENTASGVISPTNYTDLNSRDMTGCYGTYNMIRQDLAQQPQNIEMKNYLQELVSRPDWLESDNSVLYMIKPQVYTYPQDLDPSTSPAIRFRSYDYYSDPYNVNSPNLNVTWEIPSESPDDDYISSENSNDSDTYNIDTVSGTGQIFGVSTSVVAKTFLNRSNPNDMTLCNTTIIGGTTYSGVSKTPYDYYYLNYQLISEQNPATSSTWTKEEITASEFGFTTISG